MALGGSFQDHYIRMYKDMLEHELQQRSSLLRGTVTIEPSMGERTYFDVIGKVGSYTRTSRYEAKQIADQTFERRYLTPTVLEANVVIDELDLVRYAKSPESDLMRAMSDELGRQLDAIIIAAVGGTALREINGSASNASFDSNMSIAVTDITYSGSAGDLPLTYGKLLKAKRFLQTNFVDMNRDTIFVVAPAKQLTNLQATAIANGHLIRDRAFMDITLPGMDTALDGFLGMKYIAYEGTGVDGSADEYTYVFPSNAIKLGMFKDIVVDVHQRHDLAGSPTEITANLTAGAVRMFEGKVARILGDPT